MTKEEFARRLTNACDAVIQAEAELTEIDSKFGDADHGLTMTKVAKAIAQAVAASDGGIQAMLDDAAMAVMALNGGSAVPLWNPWKRRWWRCTRGSASRSSSGRPGRSPRRGS